MTGVFVSYRRADSAGWTGRLVAGLREHFPDTKFFVDIQEVRAGQNFRSAIEGALASSRVLLAIIGPRWLATEDGRRRLFEDEDLVKLEIARALALPEVHVIPVLVGTARLPSADELPDILASLAERQALELSDTRWDYDLGRLVQVLSGIGVQGGKTRSTSRRYIYAAAAVSMLLVAGLIWTMVRPTSIDSVGKRPLVTSTTKSEPDPGEVPAGKPPTTEQPMGESATDLKKPATVPSATSKGADNSTSRSETKSAANISSASKKLDGLWASSFAVWSDNSRRREVIELEVDGKRVYGRCWQEAWHSNASTPNQYRMASFSDGRIDQNTISFCVRYTLTSSVRDWKHRDCYTGKIDDKSIAFRVTYEVDGEPVENGKFVARPIAP